MSNIAELANAPELSFINHMTLQETEELVRENFVRAYREITGRDPEMSEASIAYLIIKAFCAVEYQTMQYVDAKGRAEMLKTSTGNALDNLASLLGITRKDAQRAITMMRFTLSEERKEPTAIPAGTRIKTLNGKYFRTVDYAEIPAGTLTTDTPAQAENAGGESDGIAEGEINILVDPIPYVVSVSNIEQSTGGLDIEDDDSLTKRIWLAPSKYSCAGPRDAYEYHVREWRSDVADVQIVSPEACIVDVYIVLNNGILPTQIERQSLTDYLNEDTIRPLTDIVRCREPEEIGYDISLTYWIGSSDQKSAGTIQKQIERTVVDYENWQRKLGRDINPTELVYRIREAGAKRVKLIAPNDVVIGRTQLPKCVTMNVSYGGLEDD